MNWRRVIGFTFAALGILLTVGVVGGYLYLKSNSFENFALSKIIAQANEATGGKTQIRAVDFNFSTLTAHLYDIVVHGQEPANAPPLLQVDKLTVGLKVRSVLRREVNLSELLIEHPVVHVYVSQAGESNLPQSPKPSGSNANVFDLAVRHVAISSGELNYNDSRIPMDADLHHLATEISFDALAKRYGGTISYDNGHIQYGQYASLPHALNVKFSATPSVFSLESAVLNVGSSQVGLHARVADYTNPQVTGDYDIHLHSQDLATLSPTVKSAGDLSFTGKLGYKNQANTPWLRNITLNGQFLSEGLSVVSSGTRMELRKLKGQYQLANGSLRMQGAKAESLGGRILADLDIRNLDTTPTSQARATVSGISLRAVQQSVHRTELNPVTISGTMNGTADARWSGSISNIQARCDLAVRAGAESKNSPSATNIPIDAIIHAIYDGRNNILALRQTKIDFPSTTLTATGEVSGRSNLQLHVIASDLHQLVALASSFSSSSALPPALSGSGTLDAIVQGSVAKPRINGQLNTQNLRVQGSEWKTAQVSLQADPSRIQLSNGSLVGARRGKASFDVMVALRNWSYSPANSIRANLTVRQIPVTDLQHLANVQYPVSGDLSGTIRVSGSQLNPEGTGSLNISDARAYDEPVQTLAVTFHTQNDSIISNLKVATAAGNANGELSYTPRTRAYKLRLEAPSVVLQKLRTVQAKNLGVNGTLSLVANGQGTLDDPQLIATLQLPRIDVHDKSITGIKAEVQVAHQRADLTLDSQVAEASVRARGHVDLTGNYQTDASIDTTSVPLEVLLATYTHLPEGFKGNTEFHATVKGPLKEQAKLEAHLTVPKLDATYQTLQIGAAGPIRADYSRSVLILQPFEIRGTGTSVHIAGKIPMAGTAGSDLTAKGSIDARIFHIVSPDLKSSGTIALDVHSSGAIANPQVQGQIRLQNVALSTPASPLGVQKMEGVLDVNNDRVQITHVTAEMGGGNVSAGGSITYRPSLQFNIALQGNSVRLLYPDGLRTVLDSNLDLSGTMQSSTLSGRVLIDGLSFTPDFDLATFGDQFSGNVDVPAEPGIADSINLQIAVQSKENLSATSTQVSMEGSADLQVAGTAANPIITGRTDLTAGELFYRNVRYQLQRGIITFADPNQTKPVLNVSVTTQVEQYNLTLSLRGPLDQLTTSYVSDPPLATADIINLIARGKTSSELAASSQSTDSMIASQAASQVSGSVQKLAGISSLQIDPLLGGNNQNPSARLALQQRVTKNFLFTFSTDVSQPGDELVQGDYQINKRWSVSVTRDQLGGVSIDGRLHTKF